MKILLVDDHLMFVDGLKGILEHSDLGAEVDAVHNGRDALKKILTGQFDIALIDLRLPIMDGFSLLEALNHHKSLTPIVVVSASRDPFDMNRAIDLGAMSFIPKSSSGQRIVQTIADVFNGKTLFTHESDAEPDTGVQGENARWASLHNLTPRQLEVLRLIRQGLSNQAIAAELSLSIATVKTHVSAIMAALGAESRSESSKKAHQLGLD